MSNPSVTNVDGTNTGPNVVTSPVPYLGGGGPLAVGSYATAQVGFYGVTPVSQAAYVAAVSTSAAVSGAFGFTTTQAAALLAAVNSILTALENLGIMAQS